MTKLEKALYAKWISRFGSKRVKELAAGLDVGRSIAQRSKGFVEASTEEELRQLLFEGFDGFFHQTVYLRKLTKPQATIQAIGNIPVRGAAVERVVLEERIDVSKSEVRCLLMVGETMEFLENEASVFSTDIPFPVTVKVSSDILTVQILTMQITVETWGGILEKELRRILTNVQVDNLSDGTLDFLRRQGVDIGEYIDYSSSSIDLMKRKTIDTYSGTFDVGTFGQTKHTTVRGKGKRSLRKSMPTRFKELIAAERITNAEVELNHDDLGLKEDSKVALYPTVGKIAFRSQLKGRDPDEFIKEMAGN